jgi:hypothetical protein
MLARLRSLGGAAGLVVAVAGGFGAAVGLYELPDPQTAALDAHVYSRADQRAIAVRRTDYEWGYTVLRIEASRGGSAGAEVGNAEPSPPPPGGEVATWFRATLETCPNDAECSTQFWNDGVPSEWFVFGPTMEGASFQGQVDGCDFDVEWSGQGQIAPFEAHDSIAQTGIWHADARLDGASGEASRVAPAQVDTCFTDLDVDVPGFLSVGARSTTGHVHVGAESG